MTFAKLPYKINCPKALIDERIPPYVTGFCKI